MWWYLMEPDQVPSNQWELIWRLHKEASGETTEATETDENNISREQMLDAIDTLAGEVATLKERIDELEEEVEEPDRETMHLGDDDDNVKVIPYDDVDDINIALSEHEDAMGYLRPPPEEPVKDEPEEQEEGGEDGIECPDCDSVFDSYRSWSAHVSMSDDHTPPSDVFLEDGTYICPNCEEETLSKNAMSQHFHKEHDEPMSAAAIRVMNEGDESDSPYDENGNLPKVSDGKDIMEIDAGDRPMAVKNRLDKAECALSIKEIVREHFENAEGDMSARQAVRKACKRNDDIHVLDSYPKKFYTDAADMSKSAIARASELLGGERQFDILAVSVSKLLPGEDESEVSISYSDFSAEYGGKMPTAKAWEKLCTSETVQSGLREKIGQDFEFKLTNEGRQVASAEPEKQYVLKVRR